jgi:hypothetical protein
MIHGPVFIMERLKESALLWDAVGHPDTPQLAV